MRADLPVLAADFSAGAGVSGKISGQFILRGGRLAAGKPLEFVDAAGFAELDGAASAELVKALDGIKAAAVGGWFFLKRTGEQCLFHRGLPEAGPNGERLFRPSDDFVNFLIGTDGRGMLMGTIHGNGSMPFPHVTVAQVAENAWSRLDVVKTAEGFQRFYVNGVLVHTDRESAHAGRVRAFRETGKAEPMRVAVPQWGAVGAVWLYDRALSDEEIKAGFEAQKDRCKPAHPPAVVALREMDRRNSAGLWPEPITAGNWPRHRERITAGVMKILGAFPTRKVPLEPQVISEVDCGSYLRRKVSLQVQPGDRMPAYLLIPKRRAGRAPAVVCFYGTTSGAGKETTVGLSGGKPGSPPEKNRGFALDLVEAGFVAFAADYLRDGERIAPGRRPYDTTDFYAKFPDWSIHGKDVWDTSRAIDYLQTLDFVDPDKIGMVGHSYGGHSTIFTAALEPRIKVAVSNGPVSDFRGHGLHWAVPRGGAASQSLPGLRPYVLDHTLPLPATFYEWTALIAPRPLLVGQAVGERRPMEEENYAAVAAVYEALGAGRRVRYHWYAGDHDFPPVARRAAAEWFQRWFGAG